MSELQKLTAQNIQLQFHLPKLVSKQIQEANKSMSDPNSTLMHILAKNMQNKRKIAQRSKKRHSLKNVAGAAHFSDQNAFTRHLKNYSPINSSISDLYEAKQIQQNFSVPKKNSQIGTRINSLASWDKKPQLELPGRSRIHVSYSNVSEISPQKSPKNKQLKQKLIQIRINSEKLHDKSRRLSKKAKLAQVINSRSYKNVVGYSQKIFLDLEPLMIQQEFSRTFRRGLIDLSYETKKLTHDYRKRSRKQ